VRIEALMRHSEKCLPTMTAFTIALAVIVIACAGGPVGSKENSIE
jgi:hypothetical protein